MKKHAFTVSEFVFGLTAVGMLTAALFPSIFEYAGLVEKPRNCRSNVKQIGLGIQQYIQDYDEQYPLVNSGKEGWKDIVKPYLMSEEIFQCPKEGKGVVLGTTDYFYNAKLSRLNEAVVNESVVTEGGFNYVSNTIMLGDGAGNSPANLSITQLPKSWTLNQKSPALRHLNSEDGNYAEDEAHKHGANYVFADGHAKWLTPDRVTTAQPSSSVYTFAIRGS